jgi:hypothetical protein
MKIQGPLKRRSPLGKLAAVQVADLDFALPPFGGIGFAFGVLLS